VIRKQQHVIRNLLKAFKLVFYCVGLSYVHVDPFLTLFHLSTLVRLELEIVLIYIE
jgi:hypothetical protein